MNVYGRRSASLTIHIDYESRLKPTTPYPAGHTGRSKFFLQLDCRIMPATAPLRSSAAEASHFRAHVNVSFD